MSTAETVFNKKISLCIPMYNESSIIAETAKTLHEYMSATFENYEIIFSNDGSKDGCDKIVEDLRAAGQAYFYDAYFADETMRGYHVVESAATIEELAAEGYPAFVGPTFGGKSKIELINKSFTTPGVLNKAGVKVSIITDAPVIPLQYLPMCAALAADSGLDTEEAWKAITINPAESIGIADRVGSLEPGKDGDVVIWTADPMTTVGAESAVTIVDGKIVYQA